MLTVREHDLTVSTFVRDPVDPIRREAVAYAGMRLCFVRSGSAVWEIDGCAHRVGVGDVILLDERQKRRFLSYGETGVCFSAITLDRRVLGQSRHAAFFLSCTERRAGVLHSELLYSLLTRIAAEAQSGRSDRLEMIAALLTEFFLLAQRQCGFSEKEASDPAVQQVLSHIDTHLTAPLTLQEAAQRVGLTSSTLSRRFVRFCGIGFKQYVTAQRIAFATRLLETTDKKVIDIAYESGFESISGFYDAFRKVTGTTPGHRHELI